MNSMKRLTSLAVVLAALAGTACGSKQPTGATTGSGGGSAVAPAPATPYMARRTAACEKLGPRITDCALTDAKSDLAAGKVKQADFDASTTPAILKKNTSEFVEACAVAGTTFQLRVLEVCEKEETECGALLDCLAHLNDKQP